MDESYKAGANSGRADAAMAADRRREARLFASLERSAVTAPRVRLDVITALTHVTDGFDLLMIGLVVPVDAAPKREAVSA